LLVDIRLNNKSQLAGFAKGDDLQYFLKTICNCAYQYCADSAPTKELLDAYQKKELDWSEYEKRYKVLMNERRSYVKFADRFSSYHNIALLCSESTAERCHRRLFAEMICEIHPNLTLRHI
jgi:uncharacterized protein YeaO (DUF488 family)